jgi:hypothetical protein
VSCTEHNCKYLHPQHYTKLAKLSTLKTLYHASEGKATAGEEKHYRDSSRRRRGGRKSSSRRRRRRRRAR